MRIATISHSHVHPRQRLFFLEVAKLGHEVLCIGPGEWGNLRSKSYEVDSLTYRTCRHMDDGVYSVRFLGAKDLVEDFKPDWLYVQQEPGSLLANQALKWKVGRRAIFTWENISIKPGYGGGKSHLREYDLVICGNPAGVKLTKQFNNNVRVMLQVGVDTDHFQARPQVPRDIEVGYIGRLVPEKGLPYLKEAYPLVSILPWAEYTRLPWEYSRLKTIVAYSQDVPFWREQAPNYVVLEALSCGCRAVISTTPAMVYWLGNAPGVVVAEGHKQVGPETDLLKVENLRAAIKHAHGVGLEKGRDYIVENFSNRILAKKLVEILEGECA